MFFIVIICFLLTDSLQSVCIKKLLRIKNILYELFKFNKPLTLFTDNNASKISMENGELNPKLKHISIKYHFNKDNIEKILIKLKYISVLIKC